MSTLYIFLTGIGCSVALGAILGWFAHVLACDWSGRRYGGEVPEAVFQAIRGDALTEWERANLELHGS